MSCETLPTIAELEKTKLLTIHFAELNTSRAGGVSTGAVIEYSTNPVTGEVVPTYAKDIAVMELEHDSQMQSFENDFDSRLAGMAFTRVGTFTTGATLTDMRQTLLWELSQGGDGREYSWSGAFPKVVSVASTPETTGGVGVGAWVSVGDASLRGELSSTDGDSLVGYATYTQIRSYAGSLKSIRCGGRSSIYSGDGAHGKFWRDDADTTSSDNDGTILVDSLGRRWKRKFTGSVNIKWFGAVGDYYLPDGSVNPDYTDSTDAILAALKYGLDNKTTVHAPSGAFYCSKQMTIQCTFIGAGQENTIFVCGMPDTTSWVGDEHFVRVHPSDHERGLVVEKFSIEGTTDSQAGLCITGGVMNNVRNMSIHNFGWNSIMLGNGTNWATYWSEVHNIFCKRESLRDIPPIAGSRGVYIPYFTIYRAQANVFRNVEIGGNYTILLDMDGQANYWYGGGIETFESAGVETFIRISGEDCVVKDGCYLEPRNNINPDATIVEMTSTAVSSSVTYLPFATPGNYVLDAGVINNGRKCSVTKVDRGINFQGYLPTDASSENLYPNGDWGIFDGSKPVGFRYVTSGVTKKVGAGYSSDEASLHFVASGSQVRLQDELYHLLGVKKGHLKDVEVSASVYVKRHAGSTITPRLYLNTETSYKVPDDGEWYLIGATEKCNGVSDWIHLDGTDASGSGTIEFSRLCITLTRYPRKFTKIVNRPTDLSLVSSGNASTSALLQLGGKWLFVDSTGKLRITTGSTKPTSDTDGIVVGTQS